MNALPISLVSNALRRMKKQTRRAFTTSVVFLFPEISCIGWILNALAIDVAISPMTVALVLVATSCRFSAIAFIILKVKSPFSDGEYRENGLLG